MILTSHIRRAGEAKVPGTVGGRAPTRDAPTKNKGIHGKVETMTKPVRGWGRHSCLPVFRLSREISVRIVPADYLGVIDATIRLSTTALSFR